MLVRPGGINTLTMIKRIAFHNNIWLSEHPPILQCILLLNFGPEISNGHLSPPRPPHFRENAHKWQSHPIIQRAPPPLNLLPF